MRESYKKIFYNLEKLNEMIELRKKGWSYLQLANRFNVDHTSIIYQWSKYAKNMGIPLKVKESLKFEYKKPIVINGKSYCDYVNTDINRRKSHAEKILDEIRKNY